MDEEPAAPRRTNWRLPLRLGGTGLALLLLGYFLLDFEPAREPPSRWGHLLGVVSFWIGLMLFIAAVVHMCRQPAGDEAAPSSEDDSGQEGQ
jgi:hypothetical protein